MGLAMNEFFFFLILAQCYFTIVATNCPRLVSGSLKCEFDTSSC